MNRPTIKIITLLMMLVFFTDTCCHGLATLPASQNPIAKREMLAALQRTQVRYAESEDAVRLLNANGAECLLLSSGKYLVSKDVAEDDVRLLRGIIHEDIEAVMQVLSQDEPVRYQGIKDMILKHFPPDENSDLSISLYVNHTIARAIEWLSLLKERMIQRSDIPPADSIFIDAIEPIVLGNRHNYFTVEFWDPNIRGDKIKSAINRGMRFYQVASPGPDEAGEKTRCAFTFSYMPYEASWLRQMGISVANRQVLIKRLLTSRPEFMKNTIAKAVGTKKAKTLPPYKKAKIEYIVGGRDNCIYKVTLYAAGDVHIAEFALAIGYKTCAKEDKDIKDVKSYTIKREFDNLKEMNKALPANVVRPYEYCEVALSKKMKYPMFSMELVTGSAAYGYSSGMRYGFIAGTGGTKLKWWIDDEDYKRALKKILKVRVALFHKLGKAFGIDCHSGDVMITPAYESALKIGGRELGLFVADDDYDSYDDYKKVDFDDTRQILFLSGRPGPDVRNEAGFIDALFKEEGVTVLHYGFSAGFSPEDIVSALSGALTELYGPEEARRWLESYRSAYPEASARIKKAVSEGISGLDDVLGDKYAPANSAAGAATHETKASVEAMPDNDADYPYDVQSATVLLSDLIYARLHEGRTYEIKYDTSRLTAPQIEIVEEYVRLLKLRSPDSDNIRLRPFSSANGSKESLIAVYCTGKDFNGEGHVDVTIPEGELKDYLLRITGMVNIALASSNIPDGLSKEDVDKYRPMVGYIRSQYKSILGRELDMPDDPDNILKVIRRIVLALPKSMRVDLEEVNEYNALAKEALTAA